MYSIRYLKYLLLLLIAGCSKPAEPAFDNPVDGSITITDIDGNTYETVKIGEQVWMAENLKTTHYLDGSTIPNVIDSLTWVRLDTGAWAYYDNYSSYDNIYGKLYNWYAVDDSRGLCPSGWRVQSDDDWQELEIYLGMSSSEANNQGARGEIQNIGGQLKSTEGHYWDALNVGATNQSGFTGLPGGAITHDFFSFAEGGLGYFWSSTQSSASRIWDRELTVHYQYVVRGSALKNFGMSIRCIQN